MQKNDIIELKIEDMGVDGEGIGKYDGMTFFVKDAVLGDEIEARITKMKKNYGYARVEQILSPSKFRVTPQCELHRRCGGCQIQALDYEKQLEFKQNKVRGNLIRIGGFAPELIDRIMLPVVGMKEPYRYRNKAQFPIGADKDGNPVAGFYAARTHSIIPVNDCKLGVEENQIILNEVLSYMKECHVASYDENTGKGLVRHVLIRYGFTTKELMVCVIINGNSIPKVEKLIDRLTAIEGMKSISINQNTKKTNVILGDVTKCIWGDPYITDMIHLRDTKDFSLTDTAVAYHISPQSFYQVNPMQTERLYRQAIDFAALTGGETGRCGVDADASAASAEKSARLLAKKTGAVVVASGATDLVTDGETLYCVHNGHPMMRTVTGTGCQLSALTGAYVAANPQNLLRAALAATCTMGLCGEIAQGRLQPEDGNAAYRDRIIDAVFHLTAEDLEKGARYELYEG